MPPYTQTGARFARIISGFSAPQKGDTPSAPISSVPTPSGSAPEYTPPSVEADNCGQVPSTSNKHKRPAEDPDEIDPEERAPKRTKVVKKNPAINDHIIDAVLKSGINGAEMLCSSLGRTNAFGMIIIDATIWIWRFDRQGAIQSTGINFIEDLPRFMVLLLAMQRFDLSDWGFNEKLDPAISLRHSSATPPTPQPIELEFDGENQKFKVDFEFPFGEDRLLHEVFSLKGKSTTVFKVTSDLKNNESGLVAKLYWPNQDRPNEADIIKHAHEDADLANHLPCIFGSRDLDPIGTRRIREELGIAARSPRPPRLLRIAIFEELLPITILTGDNLVFAWLECIRCHYRLWQRHIRHLDLSLANLMLRGRGVVEPKYFGVLNDWDLGDEEENRTESRKDLTKTILFTALDLLRDRLPGEPLIQLYPHDLESFAWILVWVFLAIRQGQASPGAKVTGWRTSHPHVNKKERKDFAVSPWEYIPHEEWSSYWQMARNIAAWLRSRIKEPDPNAPPEDDLELLRSFLNVAESGYTGRKPDLPKIEGL
ncbi:unnamed protein product [Rhizoctonia solani]|uniref:Fungal-type protein kinase domain-containing protein n=1 Tax=Rhizoctonia solani TaxID=456999 RepID=A0A8H3DTB0_9AGAM|nr:unnamed protein product [Rhizoctonia solani]